MFGARVVTAPQQKSNSTPLEEGKASISAEDALS
jgi:hypothetical protein